MPQTSLNGTTYAYTDEGEGDLVLFGHGLLASKEMFDAQVAALKDRYRCVSVDWPGHGASGYRENGWDFYDMVEDSASLVRELGYDRAVFAGLSQGGMVFMRLALRHPELVRGLVLLDTSAGPEDPDSLPQYEQLREAMWKGDEEMRAAATDAAQQVLYGATWRAEDPEGLAHEKQLIMAHDRDGLNLACRAVFDRDEVVDQLGQISAPTLVICGEEDVATPPDRARQLADGIPGAELVMIPRAGHHSPIENPQPVTEAIEAFLAKL
ncbi:MAG: alpha/beta fold hydrolase [Solirubrobacterales bacterium]|nr:alpha/beta fold hydrolase [Solirubrobacterales bacterium]